MAEPQVAHFPWPSPLVRGLLVRRFGRFMAEVDLDADRKRVTAHCVNTGRMEGLTRPGRVVWLSPAENPDRRLRWTWELVQLDDGTMVGTNTAAPNRMVKALLEGGLIRGFAGARWQAEVRLGEDHRADFWHPGPRGGHFVEVKNCHLVYPDGRAYFPDSVSARAAAHMRALAGVVRDGGKASVIFVVQRADARAVRPSDVHDPDYADAAREAAAAGVRFRALRVAPSPDGLTVLDLIPVELKPYATAKPARWREELRAESPAWERA